MLSLLAYKIVAALAIFLVAMIAVFYPIRAKAQESNHLFLDFGDAFASGVFLGAALFHMLPQAMRQFQLLYPEWHYPIFALPCMCGFLLLLFFERFTLSNSNNTAAIPCVLGTIIIIHSLIEGAVLGINTQIPTFSVIFIAIIAHKSSESFALGMTLTRSHYRLTPIRILIGIFALATPAALMLSATASMLLQAKAGQLLNAGFNAFAAGTFLYMSTLHHVNHHERMHEAESMLEFLCLLLGAGVMALIAVWV